MLSAGDGPKIGTECLYLLGTKEDLALQREDLEAARVAVGDTPTEENYCGYTSQGVYLGEFQPRQDLTAKEPGNPYFRTEGHFWPSSKYVFFPQETPEAGELLEELRPGVKAYNQTEKEKGDLEYLSYLVVVESDSGFSKALDGWHIMETIDARLRNDFQADIHALDFEPVAKEGPFWKVYRVDIVGWHLPEGRKTEERVPFTVDFCPEWSRHTVEAKSDVAIPGWEVIRQNDGTLEAIPRGEVMREVGDKINKFELFPISFRNALVASGYLDTKDPVRKLIDVQMKGWGVEGLECPVVTARVIEIPNPDRSCVVWREKKALEDIGREDVGFADRLEEIPGKQYRMVGESSPDFLEKVQNYFHRHFGKPGFTLSVSTEMLFNDAGCEEARADLRYSRRPVVERPDPSDPHGGDLPLLERWRPERPGLQKAKALAQLGPVKWVTTSGGGSTLEGFLQLIAEEKKVPSKSLMIVADQSGSMGGHIREIREGFEKAMDVLGKGTESGENVRTGFLSFSDNILKVRRPLSGGSVAKQTAAMRRAMDGAVEDIGGVTELRAEAIMRAVREFQKRGGGPPGDKRQIVVITDEGGRNGESIDVKAGGYTMADVARVLEQEGIELKTLYLEATIYTHSEFLALISEMGKEPEKYRTELTEYAGWVSQDVSVAALNVMGERPELFTDILTSRSVDMETTPEIRAAAFGAMRKNPEVFAEHLREVIEEPMPYGTRLDRDTVSAAAEATGGNPLFADLLQKEAGRKFIAVNENISGNTEKEKNIFDLRGPAIRAMGKNLPRYHDFLMNLFREGRKRGRVVQSALAQSFANDPDKYQVELRSLSNENGMGIRFPEVRATALEVMAKRPDLFHEDLRRSMNIDVGFFGLKNEKSEEARKGIYKGMTRKAGLYMEELHWALQNETPKNRTFILNLLASKEDYGLIFKFKTEIERILTPPYNEEENRELEEEALNIVGSIYRRSGGIVDEKGELRSPRRDWTKPLIKQVAAHHPDKNIRSTAESILKYPWTTPYSL